MLLGISIQAKCSGSIRSLVFLFTTAFFILLFIDSGIATQSRWMSDQDGRRAYKRDGRDRSPRDERLHSKQRKNSKPNIIFLITDDQDSELGSMSYMPKTLNILRDGGAWFNNAFVTTPMCCPSRSSMLTGKYVHNHNTYTNNDNCSSIQWQQTHEKYNFATYLSNVGYRTGYFGKYLNEYNGSYIPPGWSEWVGLIRNTRFYNYSLNFNNKRVKHGDDYHQDYLTDLIANDSVTFLKQSKQYFPNRPVLMVLSMPAPHGPEDAAPQYQHLFPNVTTHRTPAWNYAPNPDKQWILQYNGKMEPIHIAFTDMLQRKRLQTLQSVDDALEKVYKELKSLGELDNTYIIYSSDHGYHLGQFGLLKGKAMPYDFDIRVPFYIRGPRIPEGIRVPNIVLNVDIAPTILDMAGVDPPDTMDGKSIMKLFEDIDLEESYLGQSLKKKKAWRDTFLVERGKISQKLIISREKMEAQKNKLGVTKDERLDEECLKLEYQPPCSGKQQWVCMPNPAGRLRMFKCRNIENQLDETLPTSKPCQCPKDDVNIQRAEKKLQRQFLFDHVNKPKDLKPRFIRQKRRLRRSRRKFLNKDDGDLFKVTDIKQEQFYAHKHFKDSPPQNDAASDLDIPPYGLFDQRRLNTRTRDKKPFGLYDMDVGTKKRRHTRDVESIDHPISCRVYPNDTVVCSEEIYNDFDEWKDQKIKIDDMIEDYKQQIENLQDIKQHLKEVRLSGEYNFSEQASGNGTADFPYDDEVDDDIQNPDQEFGIIEENKDANRSEVSQNNPKDQLEHDDKDVYFNEEIIDQGDMNEYEDNNDGDEDSEFDSFEFDDEDLDPLDDTDEFFHELLSGNLDKHSEDKGEECNCEDELKVSNTREAIKQEREIRRQKKREERSENREKRKLEKGKEKNKKKKKSSKVEVTKDCSSPHMKCFSHDNDHWKTAPLWDYGPFCFCPNSNNNTYWCVRTINDTHNFLYCEFITGFISFYDMMDDPYQLRNAVYDLDYGVLQQLHYTLGKLKECSGSRECTIRTRPDSESNVPIRKNKKGRVLKNNGIRQTNNKWARRQPIT